MNVFLTSICLVLCLNFGLCAQDTGDIPYFRLGDTMYRAIDVLPGDNMGGGWDGETPYWDYSRLLAPFVHKVQIVAPGRISDMCKIPPQMAFTGLDGVEYFLYQGEQGIWLSALMFTSGDRRWLATTSDKFPWRVETEDTDAAQTHSGNFEIYPVASYQALGEQFSAEVISTRSNMRFSIDITGTHNPGRLAMPRGQYTVVEQVIHYSYADRFSQELVDNEWRNTSAEMPMDLPMVLTDHYDVKYWSPKYVEPIVSVHQNLEHETQSIEFRILPFGVPVYPGKTGQMDVFVYPNPSYGEVRFDFLNLPADTYTLEIYNILGVRLRNEQFVISGSKTIQYDFSDLRKGTYIYRLVDSASKTIRSKRLVIVEP